MDGEDRIFGKNRRGVLYIQTPPSILQDSHAYVKMDVTGLQI